MRCLHVCIYIYILTWRHFSFRTKGALRGQYVAAPETGSNGEKKYSNDYHGASRMGFSHPSSIEGAANFAAFLRCLPASGVELLATVRAVKVFCICIQLAISGWVVHCSASSKQASKLGATWVQDGPVVATCRQRQGSTDCNAQKAVHPKAQRSRNPIVRSGSACHQNVQGSTELDGTFPLELRAPSGASM